MIYNFDEIIDRSQNRAAKYDERLKKFGKQDVIPLWVADMDFRTAQPVMDALKAKAEEGIWGYTSRPDSYFDSYRNWQLRRNGWDIKKEMMSWSLGVVPAMSAIVRLFSDPGDSILIQTPVYSEFYDVTEASGRHVLENQLVETEDGWQIDFDDFRKKAAKSKIFLLCSPHNPLGRVWTGEELQAMVQICLEHDVLLVSDEIHSDLIFHGRHHIPTASLSLEAAESCISCISATKTFNLAGLQASTTIFPNLRMKEIYDQFWMGMDIHRNNAFSSVAMEAALNEGEEWLEQLLSYIDGNFQFLQEYCRKYIPRIRPNLPDATYLVWLDCRALGLDNEALRSFMIEKAGLGLNEGCSFGRSLSGFMRLNAACPRATLETALSQLKDAVDHL